MNASCALYKHVERLFSCPLHANIRPLPLPVYMRSSAEDFPACSGKLFVFYHLDGSSKSTNFLDSWYFNARVTSLCTGGEHLLPSFKEMVCAVPTLLHCRCPLRSYLFHLSLWKADIVLQPHFIEGTRACVCVCVLSHTFGQMESDRHNLFLRNHERSGARMKFQKAASKKGESN